MKSANNKLTIIADVLLLLLLRLYWVLLSGVLVIFWINRG